MKPKTRPVFPSDIPRTHIGLPDFPAFTGPDMYRRYFKYLEKAQAYHAATGRMEMAGKRAMMRSPGNPYGNSWNKG